MIAFGGHSQIADRWGISPGDYPPDATTRDHDVAAAGGSLTATYEGALEARGIDVSPGNLSGTPSGD
jgi:hypothetical protein